MKKAIIYSAHGEEYVKESIEFANQTRKSITNDTSLILHTAAGTDFNLLNNSPFDIIITQEMNEVFIDKEFGFKIQCMIHSCEALDFDQFLFLDSDARIMKSGALEVFDLLNQFDIAVAHAPVRHVFFHRPELSNLYSHPKNDTHPPVPLCFPEFNTGVILFKKTCISLFKKWQELYLNDFIKHPHDQGSFRRAVYFSNLRIATLAPEYNDRRNKKGCFISHQRNIKCM